MADKDNANVSFCRLLLDPHRFLEDTMLHLVGLVVQESEWASWMVMMNTDEPASTDDGHGDPKDRSYSTRYNT